MLRKLKCITKGLEEESFIHRSNEQLIDIVIDLFISLTFEFSSAINIHVLESGSYKMLYSIRINFN